MMNTLKKIYGTLALLLVCAAAWGQTVDPDVSKGKFETTSGEIHFKNTTQINLKERVHVGGTEATNTNKSLVIRNIGENTLTITNAASEHEDSPFNLKIKDTKGNEILTIEEHYTLYDMFHVADGETLEIDGGEHGIIIDGGSKLGFPDNFPQSIDIDEGTTGHRKIRRACIYTAGTLILKNVTFVNGDFCNADGGHIRINGPSGTTTIDNCTFTRARSYQGCGISVNSLNESPTSTDKIAITIKNSTFKQCYLKKFPDGHDQSGAIFRFNGTWCGDLEMTDCIMENNYTAGDVNSLQWNAIGNGTLEPKCTMKGCTFRNNVAAGNGATMLIEGTISFEDAVTKVYNNEAKGFGGGIWVNGYSGGVKLNPRTEPIEIDLNEWLEVSNNTAGTYGGGVAFRFPSGSTLPQGTKLNVNLSGAKIYKNTSTEDGGGVYIINSTKVGPADAKDETGKLINQNYIIKVNLDGSEINDNRSGNYGGGIYVINERESDEYFSVNLNTGKVYDNTADDSGGGIYVEKADVHIGKTEGGSLSVTGNKANVSGGGLYVHGGNVDIDDITLDDNEAVTKDGGAIKMSKAGSMSPTMTMNKGTITNNKAAVNGGGIHIENGDFEITDNAVMEYNSAKEYGGAVALSGGDVNISGEVSVRNNTATLGGGGIYVNDGGVTIARGDISRNTSNGDGGGLLVKSTTAKTLTFDGGVFAFNRARCGGGIATEGPVNLSLSATVQNNYATNGGGIYLSKEAEMTFSDGLIRGNHANGTSTSLTTAYQGTGATLLGVGGGVFLDSNTSLKFSMTQAFGIYSNVAEFAADDIFANGVSTNVDLPAVENMTLKDFDVPTNKLYWMEDYMNNDAAYMTGVATDMAGKAGAMSYRYQQSLREYKDLRHLIGKTATGDLSDYYEKYLCLTLGYELVYLTLIKEGLEFGDDATFIFSYKKEGDMDFTPYQKIIVTGKAPNNQNSVWESIALPEGNWKIEESDWSWEYSDTPEYTYYKKNNNNNNELIKQEPTVNADGAVELTRDGVNAIKVKNTKIPVTDPTKYVRSFDFHKLNIMNPVE